MITHVFIEGNFRIPLRGKTNQVKMIQTKLEDIDSQSKWLPVVEPNNKEHQKLYQKLKLVKQEYIEELLKITTIRNDIYLEQRRKIGLID